MAPIRLVMADDHPLLLDGLESLFRIEGDIEIVARCTDGNAVLPLTKFHDPDILLLDVRMPNKDGLAILRELREDGLTTRVVLLTAELDEDEMIAAMRLGVRGLILKEMAPKLLVQCIRTVHAGEEWMERASVRQAVEKMLRGESREIEIAALLTRREIDILRLAVQGLRNKAIADNLCITEGTVKIHLHNVYEKLQVDGRVALLKYVREKGIA